jgi:hypothetical protein
LRTKTRNILRHIGCAFAFAKKGIRSWLPAFSLMICSSGKRAVFGENVAKKGKSMSTFQERLWLALYVGKEKNELHVR